MKLLHVCPTLNPEAGGTVTAILNLAAAQPAQQEILCLDASSSPWLSSQPFPVHAIGSSTGKYAYAARLVPWLKAQAPRYSAIIVHGVWQYHSLAVWQATRETRTPYFLYPHGMLDPWFQKNYPLKHLKKSVYWHLLEKRVLRDAAGVLFTAEDEQSGAHRSFSFPPCREEILPLGIAEPPPAPATGMEPNPVSCLLFLGRLDVKKGCDLLLRAFAQVMRGQPWKLVMAGPDSAGWQGKLQELAESLGLREQVVWPGMLRGAEKWAALRGASALILPSHQENFGMVVAEALACHVPVLLSRRVNIWREIVTDGAGLAAEDTESGTVELLQNWSVTTEKQRAHFRMCARRSFESRFAVAGTWEKLSAYVVRVTAKVGQVR